jgi:hypothetical protein
MFINGDNWQVVVRDNLCSVCGKQAPIHNIRGWRRIPVKIRTDPREEYKETILICSNDCAQVLHDQKMTQEVLEL